MSTRNLSQGSLSTAKALVAGLVAAWFPVMAAADTPLLPDQLRLPPGFSVETLVKVAGARSMALGDAGTLFVATQRGSGNVYAVRNPFGGNPQVLTIMDGFLDRDNELGRPVYILVAPDGSLLVSDDTGGAIYRISYDPENPGRVQGGISK